MKTSKEIIPFILDEDDVEEIKPVGHAIEDADPNEVQAPRREYAVAIDVMRMAPMSKDEEKNLKLSTIEQYKTPYRLTLGSTMDALCDMTPIKGDIKQKQTYIDDIGESFVRVAYSRLRFALDSAYASICSSMAGIMGSWMHIDVKFERRGLYDTTLTSEALLYARDFLSKVNTEDKSLAQAFFNTAMMNTVLPQYMNELYGTIAYYLRNSIYLSPFMNEELDNFDVYNNPKDDQYKIALEWLYELLNRFYPSISTEFQVFEFTIVSAVNTLHISPTYNDYMIGNQRLV